jgi:hypothetical protein
MARIFWVLIIAHAFLLAGCNSSHVAATRKPPDNSSLRFCRIYSEQDGMLPQGVEVYISLSKNAESRHSLLITSDILQLGAIKIELTVSKTVVFESRNFGSVLPHTARLTEIKTIVPVQTDVDLFTLHTENILASDQTKVMKDPDDLLVTITRWDSINK